jgi:hypothetical protein
MSALTDQVCELINECSEQEKHLVLSYLRQRVSLHPLEQQWATTAEAILTAIARSTDLTLRGIRGILAEATFGEVILPNLESAGWHTISIHGDQAYDFLLERDAALACEFRSSCSAERKASQRSMPSAHAPR